MNKRIFALLPALFALTGCDIEVNDLATMINENKPGEGGPGQGPQGPIDNAPEHIEDGGIDDGKTSGEEIEIKIDDGEEGGEVVVTDPVDTTTITDTSVDGITYDDTNKLFTITKAGEFIFTGEFNGNIYVNAGEEDDVKITLNSFTIKSTTDSPIKCDSANELQISLKKGTANHIYDYRTTKTVDNDAQGNGAITSSCDMKVTGKGSLTMVAKYYNGFHCKDDLTLKPEVFENSSIQIESYNNCLKGNDSVDIQSGNFVLISTNGNGILTENTDVSTKGNQRGNITISGGQVDIYSAKDAIDAAYNAEISASDPENEPVINIYTSKYSSYSGDVSETSESKLYLRLSSSFNTSSYYYAVEFLSSDYYTSWVKASVVSSSSSYKYLVVDKPAKATSMKVFAFANSVTEMSEANATYSMNSYSTINTNYDMARLSIRDGVISISGWSTYGSTQSGGQGGPGGGPGGGGMQEGNTEKAEVSAKGIKADNAINISAGTFFIKTYDDAIHANYGTALENSTTGVGDVTISGGHIEIYASDDGVHADHTLTVSGGQIEIQYSYEGIEGNIINFTGGYTKVYSIDDGLNAANKSGVTPAITVNGGVVDVTVYGQDVDGIDSNGSFTQNGGYVITKGGNSQMSTGLDVDGTAKINGGTFLAFGRTENTPSTGTGVTTYSLSGSYGIGTYTVKFADSTTVDVTTKYSYSIIYAYSDTSTKVTVTKK